MKERGILFSAPMVRAILDGSKTQTRRIVKPQPALVLGAHWVWRDIDSVHTPDWVPIMARDFSPYGAPGDRLWVRETWQAWERVSYEHDEWEPIDRERRAGATWAEWLDEHRPPDAIEYRATSESQGPWTPAIHMPRWASRITLEVTGVRVERLQAITEADANAEGVRPFPLDLEGDCWTDGTYRTAYNHLWNEINGWNPNSWAANPWVWVVEFKRITQP
jgi:hypothetical protein